MGLRVSIHVHWERRGAGLPALEPAPEPEREELTEEPASEPVRESMAEVPDSDRDRFQSGEVDMGVRFLRLGAPAREYFET
eukprot:4941081-Alexandrium_andersonii.AAC.1